MNKICSYLWKCDCLGNLSVPKSNVKSSLTSFFEGLFVLNTVGNMPVGRAEYPNK